MRATDEATPLPYVYPVWPYAVNRTTAAKLNISKLHNGSAPCPAPLPATYQPAFVNGQWVSSDPNYVITTLYNATYTPELNIKGSYVYGYNWNLRADVVAPEVNKAGWWRLTFYTTDNSVDFSTWVDPISAGANTLAPPESTLTSAPPTALVEAEEEEEGTVYTPVVDATNNVTYIDICILASKGGGGKKK